MWPYLDKVCYYDVFEFCISFSSCLCYHLSNFSASVFYFKQAICKTVKNIAKPIIAEQIPKYKIDSVEFEKLTLGTLPPTFQGEYLYILCICLLSGASLPFQPLSFL